MNYAPRWLLPLLLCLGLLVTHRAFALEDAKLALGAAQYRQLIQDGRNAQGQTAAALLQQAQQQQKKDRALALATYETAIVAGADNTATWLALTELWQTQAQRQEQESADYEVRQRSRQRAQQAAWNALQVAASARERARALFYLGEMYDQDQQAKAAITALREALDLEDQPRFAKRYQELLAAHSFQIKGVDVESDSAQPRICLQFSDQLAKGRELHYEDYVRIEPPVTLVASAEDKQLCLTGVHHGQNYQIKVRAGVPAADGQRTSSAQQFSAKVADRKPSLGFRGATYVLPKVGSQQLPLTSVNLAQARLRVLRINDRNLPREIDINRITNLLDGYDVNAIAKRSGEELWQGTLTLASGELNQEVTTAIPISELLPQPQPGVYIIAAQLPQKGGEDYDWENQATQWLVISDLGLFTLRGNDGLHVFVRSLASAEAQAGVELRLYARNNNELGKALTDKQGYVRFDPGLLRGNGGQEPAALMAFSKGDYNFLDLTKPAFDLSDRGVAGRPAPGALDAFLYSERGVYRPGETVQLMSLLRDSHASVVADTPLTLKLFRPDEVEAAQLHLTQAALGGYHAQIPLAANARTGTWTAKAYTDPKGAALGEVRFQVEDFVPQQLKVELSTAAQLLQPQQPITLQVRGQFLYGAAAANLKAEAELVLGEDGNPYPDFPGYRFGLAEEVWMAQHFPLPLAGTDAEGKAEVPVNLTQLPDTTRPLQAKLRVSLFEPGGRAVSRSLDIPYRIHPFAIGIKPRFGDGGVPSGQEATFDVLVLDAHGQAQAKDGLQVKLVREEPEFYWYHQDGRWNYKLVVQDRAVLSSQTVNVSATQPALVSNSALQWGRYRVEVIDPKTGIASSLRFHVGWFDTPGATDTPDQMQVTLDQPRYRAGDNAKVLLRAPFAGEVLVNVVGERLWLSKTVSVSAEGSSIELPVSAAWGAGAYVTATAFRSAAGASHAPGRAIGVAWIGLDPAPRTLQINLDAPKEWQPRQTVTLPIQVTGLAAGDSAYVTLAAVDEGILQLTDFANPDPLQYFLGKRRLGMQILDLYGKLIESGGKPGALKVGGDASARQLNASSLRTTKTVALFSGPLALDAEGKANIPLELPDFNGQLRLMAVAWDEQRFGQAATSALVRDPIMARVDVPRFLAPNDASSITVQVQNLSAAPGAYQVQLSAQGAVALDEPSSFTFTVAEHTAQNQEVQRFTLRGQQPGAGLVRLQVSGAAGLRLTHDTAIAVRPAQTVTSTRSAQQLAAGVTWQLDDALLADYVPGTAQVNVSVASKPHLNVPALLRQLDRYPYGCLEQTTSRALPLLYFNQVAQAWLGADATEAALRQRVQEALQRLFNMQDAGGGFGLWGVDSEVETWLSAYAMEFVSRARQEGYLVPAAAWHSGLNYLRERLSSDDFNDAELGWRAYALYVLAREQQAAIGDLRYVHDNYLQKMPSAAAQAQLGAALARYGELERANEAFKAALVQRKRPALRDYGSSLRDRAAVLALLAESGLLSAELPSLAAQVAEQFAAQRYTSTQEQSWLLLAARALSQNAAPLNVSVNGQAVTADPLRLTPSAQQLADKITLVNQGQQALWMQLEISGVPTALQPAAQHGFNITRRYYTRNGQPLDPQQIKQHDLIVAVISGHATEAGQHQALVVDLLPAGLEIENARLAHNNDASEIAWLPQLTQTLHTEIRDDRFVAALDLESDDKRNFTLAYLLRAVTPGTYQQPAVYVEDMYQPWQFARGAMGVVQVR